jgi:hypothetical protein
MRAAAGWVLGLLTFFGLGALARNGSGSSSSAPSSPPAIDPYPTRADVTQHPATPRAPRPGVEAFRRYVLHRWGGTDLGIWASAQHHDQNPHSEHEVGQAWDWGFPNSQAVDELLSWLEDNGDEWARRTGVGYLLFNRRERRWFDPRGWAPYNGSDPHTTHVHLSFSRAGAMGETSAYTGGFLT